MTGRIFISYRRDDARADARSIFQRLERAFGAEQLFMDVDSIPRGTDFRAMLDQCLKQCRVMLVVIGQHWTDAGDEDGRRRLDDPSDYVRLEIALALKRGIAVIPVLIDGARLPRQDRLPADLRPLVYRQAARVRHDTFAQDVDALERDVEGLLKAGARRRQSAALVAVLAAACAAAAVWYWQRGTAFSSAGTVVARAAEDVAAYTGVPPVATALARWQRDVKPARLRIQDSPSIGRASSLQLRLSTLSGGKLELAFAPAGASLRPAEQQEALTKGAVDAVWEAPVNWSASASALALFGGQVPFGLDNHRYAAWIAGGGGAQLHDLYQRRVGWTVTAVLCRLWPSFGLWMRRPLASPADLAGQTIRTRSYLLVRLLPRLGAKASEIGGSEIVAAIDRGTVDGAVWSDPNVDFELGLHKAARYYYQPGLHSPSMAGFLHFDAGRWQAFDPATRGLIFEACRQQVADDIRLNDDAVQKGIARLKAEGVEVQALPPAVRAAAERAMQEVAAELSAADADFKRLYATYKAQK